MGASDVATVATAGSDTGWTPRRAIAFTLIVLAVGLAFVAVLRLYAVIFALITAVTLHIAVNPFVTRLKKRGVHSGVATTVVYLVVLITVGGFLALVLPFIVEQLGTIAERLPVYYTDTREGLLTSGNSTLMSFARGLPETINVMSMLPTATPSSAPTAPASTPTATAATQSSPLNPLVSGLFSIIAIAVLAFYWTLNSDRLTYGLTLRMPEARREELRALIAEIEDKVGAFFRGQIVLCGFVGVLSLIAYVIIGLPYALVLALIAFVCEAIPMIGPALGAVPAMIIALAIAPDKAVFVIVATLVIQQVENNILVPKVMDHAVGVNPIVAILSIAAFTVLFGLAGALLAIPLAAVLQIVLNRVLFQPTATEGAAAPVDLTSELQITGGRDRLSVLRMEAREIAEDVRKQMRNSEVSLPESHESVEDALEAIALDLDSLLAQKDEPGLAAMAANASSADDRLSPVVRTDVPSADDPAAPQARETGKQSVRAKLRSRIRLTK